MNFLRQNRAFLALLIPFMAIPWITLGDYHLMLFNFSHNRFEYLGFATEMSTSAMVMLVILLGISLALVSALSLSRFYCGTLCPNTLFAHFLSLFKRRKRALFSKIIGFSALTFLSSALAFSVAAYGVSTHELIDSLIHLNIAGWLVVVLSFLMIAEVYMVQGWYCAYLCPYGAICAILPIEDRLSYTYTDPDQHCTGCGGCVKICPIPALDIRDGFDIRCIQCGLCESACEKTFAKSPITALIQHDKCSVLQAGGKNKGILFTLILIAILTAAGITLLLDEDRLESCRLENSVLY